MGRTFPLPLTLVIFIGSPLPLRWWSVLEHLKFFGKNLSPQHPTMLVTGKSSQTFFVFTYGLSWEKLDRDKNLTEVLTLPVAIKNKIHFCWRLGFTFLYFLTIVGAILLFYLFIFFINISS